MKRSLSRALALLLCALLLGLAAGCQRGGEEAVPEVPLDTILQNIRDAYGDSYIPNVELPPELLESTYGLTAELYGEVRAEMAMISTFPDTVIVVKAAQDKGDAVEQALATARENAISNTLQYPMNIPKTNATQVVRKGDYVAFLMVGATGDFDDVSSQEAREFAEAEVQKGVDAFYASFQ